MDWILRTPIDDIKDYNRMFDPDSMTSLHQRIDPIKL